MSKGHAFGLGILSGAVLVLALLVTTRSAGTPAYAAETVDSDKGMVVASVAIGSQQDALVVIDTQQKRLALYNLNQGKEIVFKSVRQITWDLQGYDWANSGSKGPPVDEIKKAVEKANK
ncbi:MAG: hypothetical protein HYY93_04270 [Planctomycetes bacterium]|nr:hypothetical protein [Planctomycetota bacterium]